MVLRAGDYPVAVDLAAVSEKYKINEEIRYTPIMTRSPVEFSSKGYRCEFATGACTVFVVITMYNEGVDELKRTLRGICENIQSFVDEEGDSDFWKRITVCIVSDGRANSSLDTLEWATEMGIFSQEKVNQQLEINSDVGVHLFENTIRWLDDNEVQSKYPPIQIMFALKEHNGGKINSHYWFFSAFAAQINPEFCMLLDVGTKPRAKALYYLWQTMHRNGQIGGCCGEICTMSRASLNPILAAQTFEYKVSNFLDKATESVCGYISVLPGAFSAYRHAALIGAPLDKYFHHISTPMEKMTPFEANQYLAEDRILCFELLAKAGCDYTLHYDKRAIAETDAPTDLVDLIKQRRRWLNGSLLATLYTVMNIWRFLKDTRHSLPRKLVITIQFVYYLIGLALAWFLVANIYLTFSFSLIIMLGNTHIAFILLRYLFLALIITQFVLGLGNQIAAVSQFYHALAALWCTIFALTTGLSIYTLIAAGFDIVFLATILAASFGLVLVASFLHGEILILLGNVVQYLLISPVFLIIMPIFSICNLHDISWGTKGISEAAEIVKDDNIEKADDVNERVRAKLRRVAKLRQAEKVLKVKQQGRFGRFRSLSLLTWMFSQGLYVSLMLTADEKMSSNHIVSEYFLRAMFLVVAGTNMIRFIGSMIYLLLHNITRHRIPPAYPSSGYP